MNITVKIKNGEPIFLSLPSLQQIPSSFVIWTSDGYVITPSNVDDISNLVFGFPREKGTLEEEKEVPILQDVEVYPLEYKLNTVMSILLSHIASFLSIPIVNINTKQIIRTKPEQQDKREEEQEKENAIVVSFDVPVDSIFAVVRVVSNFLHVPYLDFLKTIKWKDFVLSVSFSISLPLKEFQQLHTKAKDKVFMEVLKEFVDFVQWVSFQQ